MALPKHLSLILAASVLLASSFSPRAEAVIDCATVFHALLPCYTYVVGGGSNVPPQCCSGLSKLVSSNYNVGDVRAACTCLKAVFPDVGGTGYSRAMDIPSKCGVNVGFQFGGGTNCTNIH